MSSNIRQNYGDIDVLADLRKKNGASVKKSEPQVNDAEKNPALEQFRKDMGFKKL